MTYLTKEETLKEWAELVTETSIQNLKQIQEVRFLSELLCRLDPEYYQPILVGTKEELTFSELFGHISRYYSKEMGTNIKSILGDDVNIYSNSCIEELWELVLGIAIKGRNREKNINVILNMRPQTQEELMRIISKLINNLGENVSVIDNSSIIAVPVHTNNDTDIIIELSEENEQLREKLEDKTSQVAHLNEKIKICQMELEDRNKEKKQLLDLMLREESSSKFKISSHSSDFDVVLHFFKDVIGHNASLSKELARKEERLIFLEDINKDLKVAYSTAMIDLDQAKEASNYSSTGVNEIEKKVEMLRLENLEFLDREKSLLSKIGELEEQKYYLKDIVQRLEIKNNLSEQKIDKIVKENGVISNPQSMIEDQEYENRRAEPKSMIGSMIEPDSPIRMENKRTMKYEVDELNQPNERNKLQREVSHLQKKINSLQEQNGSLKKINMIMEKVINDFTKESGEIMKQYESEFEPLFEEFERIIQEEQNNRKSVEDEANENRKENELKIKEIMTKMKEKIDEYDNRCLEYQKMVMKLEIERDELLKLLSLFEEKQKISEMTPNKETKVETKKEPKVFGLTKVEVSVAPTEKNSEIFEKTEEKERHEEEVEEKVEQKVEETPNQQRTESELLSEEKFEEKSPELPKPNKQLFKTIIDETEEEEGQNSNNKYIGNRLSIYELENTDLIFKEKIGLKSKLSFGSDIYENVKDQISESSENAYVESSTLLEIFDITQIEEQLLKIKQQYVGLTSQGQEMCKKLIFKSKVVDNAGSEQSNLGAIASEYERMLESKNGNEENLTNYLKSVEKEGIELSKIRTENIKLRQENEAFRRQQIIITKERKQIEERLTFLHEQSSKNQEERTKEELKRIGGAIKDIQNIMILSQNQYIELQQYLLNERNENDNDKVGLLNEVEGLRLALKEREYAVEQLEMESKLLMGAVLEFRNSSIQRVR